MFNCSQREKPAVMGCLVIPVENLLAMKGASNINVNVVWRASYRRCWLNWQ